MLQSLVPRWEACRKSTWLFLVSFACQDAQLRWCQACHVPKPLSFKSAIWLPAPICWPSWLKLQCKILKTRWACYPLKGDGCAKRILSIAHPGPALSSVWKARTATTIFSSIFDRFDLPFCQIIVQIQGVREHEAEGAFTGICWNMERSCSPLHSITYHQASLHLEGQLFEQRGKSRGWLREGLSSSESDKFIWIHPPPPLEVLQFAYVGECRHIQADCFRRSALSSPTTDCGV